MSSYICACCGVECSEECRIYYGATRYVMCLTCDARQTMCKTYKVTTLTNAQLAKLLGEKVKLTA